MKDTLKQVSSGNGKSRKAGSRKARLFIDLFAGCGGLSLGLFEAGWRGLFAVERDPYAFSSLSNNLLVAGARHRFRWPREIPRRPLDIMECLSEHREYLEGLRDLDIDLVCGGPPCQGFSFSGRRQQSDPRNRLLAAYAEFVRTVGPRYLLIENVPGILVPHGTKARRAANPRGVGRPPISFAQKLHDLLAADDGPGGGYEFDKCLVDASDFGVPQRRKRYFGLGIRRDLLETHALAGFEAGGVLYAVRDAHLAELGLTRKPVTAREAIGDLRTSCHPLRACEDPDSPSGRFDEIDYAPPRYLNRYLRVVRASMNGEAPNSIRLARHTPEVESRFALILDTCRRGVRLDEISRSALAIKKMRIVPLAAEQPSHTITTLPDDILHFEEPRILTVRECARLQSFPDWFGFSGKFTTGGDRRTRECPRYTQVGNAVPPLLARAWGKAISELDTQLSAERVSAPRRDRVSR